MDKQTIAALNKLQDHLQRVECLDAHDRQVVAQLRTDVQALLSESAKTEADTHSIREQLQSAIQRFEVSHPDLTSVMAAVVDSLVNIGI